MAISVTYAGIFKHASLLLFMCLDAPELYPSITSDFSVAHLFRQYFPKLYSMRVMFTTFVCALLSFRARRFPGKSGKTLELYL